jgi:hypothetical protein
VQDRTILVLGGAGLVGYQVAHRIGAELRPERIVIASLTQEPVERAIAGLRALVPAGVELIGEWGDLFLRDEFSETSRHDLLDDDAAREGIFDDLLGPLDAAYRRSRLAQVVSRYRPDVVVDAINTATAISYQDVYSSAILAERDVEEILEGREVPPPVLAHDVETLILSLSVPQLIRHVMILHRALRDAGTRLYLKVGTTGTGGFGLNIPYTHSEDRPSAKLLTKTAVAFAHTGLLFLMARTPDGPLVKEIKPGALVGYSDVRNRTITEHGETVHLYRARSEPIGATLQLQVEPEEFSRLDDLRLPVVDTGENGVFTKGEFEAITALGQMEFVTPEEIASLCIQEILGGQTGRDVIAALDGSVLGPSYRGGVLRSRVLAGLSGLEDETGTHSVALGQLGPPELSKLLWEAELLAVTFGRQGAVLEETPESLATAACDLLEQRPGLRDTITSLGIPILSCDGATLHRGPSIRIPEVPGASQVAPTPEDLDRWAAKGWVDLRPANFARWQDRFRAMRAARHATAQPGSAGVTPETTLSDEIETGATAAWVLRHELGGWRVK